jgi:hypothetical protein
VRRSALALVDEVGGVTQRLVPGSLAFFTSNELSVDESFLVSSGDPKQSTPTLAGCSRLADSGVDVSDRPSADTAGARSPIPLFMRDRAKAW